MNRNKRYSYGSGTPLYSRLAKLLTQTDTLTETSIKSVSDKICVIICLSVLGCVYLNFTTSVPSGRHYKKGVLCKVQYMELYTPG